jgi:GMP synthase (glutamine-hydrolysing)
MVKRFLIINNAEIGQTEFSDPLINILDYNNFELVVIYWNEIMIVNKDDDSSFLKQDGGIVYLNEFDGIFGTGSPQGDDPMESHAPHYQWLLSTKIPYFGICAGHHMVSYMCGLPLIRDGSQSESGELEVKIVNKNDPIFRGFNKESFIVKQMHNDAISLPDNFVVLASSDNCNVQMMRDITRPIFYTTQFHPEILNFDLIWNFVHLVEEFSHLQEIK